MSMRGSSKRSGGKLHERNIAVARDLFRQRDFPVQVVLHRLLHLALAVVGLVIHVICRLPQVSFAGFERQVRSTPGSRAAREDFDRDRRDAKQVGSGKAGERAVR